jgi:menaquinone-9 beta-reductase
VSKTPGRPDASPVIVAGGGLSGGAAACLLARAGIPVLVLERETQPTDKICGEFLSNEAQLYLERIGVDAAFLGAHLITNLRLVCGGDVAEATLPFRAFGLSRRVLDEAVLERASEYGAEIRRGERVRRAADEEILTLETPSLGRLQPQTLFLATGKYDTPGLRRTLDRAPEELVGFKAYFHLAPNQTRALNGYVELVLFNGGYAGLQLVEGGRANLCLLVDREMFMRCGGHWHELLDELKRTCVHLRNRLRDAEPLLEHPISIFRVPYGYVCRPSRTDPPGVFRLGDQCAVTPSFSGDGMSIALHSATMAVDAYLAGAGADLYHRRMRQDVAGQIMRAGWLYRVGRWAPAQSALVRLARSWPRGLQLAASWTRLPSLALAKGFS